MGGPCHARRAEAQSCVQLDPVLAEIGVVSMDTLDEDEGAEYADNDDQIDWEDGDDNDPAVIAGKDNEIDNMDSFEVYELYLRNSRDWSNCKQLTVR